ncbi:conserved hypothetical protein [Pyrobaculum neutrophilum V24Sta]|uniref:Uncharacterized protein n=1 Tax=Pyrobaculum neutrophilum (strain DSM 2338 / JCM 9278 / NBRC 100436 / V24Sta) TaxID=444157 RepID=B1YCY8_PYRNV|nr:conserved hypothetical protein [Pyrobaculum neutrophilum V24Sta]
MGREKIKIVIKIYKNKFDKNRKYIVLKNDKYNISLIKSIPSRRAGKYVESLKKSWMRVRIERVEPGRVKIREEISGSGWLYFPSHRLAIGVVFLGSWGVLAASSIPSREPYFLPIGGKPPRLLGVRTIDFY